MSMIQLNRNGVKQDYVVSSEHEWYIAGMDSIREIIDTIAVMSKQDILNLGKEVPYPDPETRDTIVKLLAENYYASVMIFKMHIEDFIEQMIKLLSAADVANGVTEAEE